LSRILSYFARLTNGRIVLWSYLVWYLVTVATHFDPSPRLWATSIGLSAIIGVALWISTRSGTAGTTELDRWQVFRLFLMPFCVSSFAALVKDEGYVLVFPPTMGLNVLGLALVAAFVASVLRLRAADAARHGSVEAEPSRATMPVSSHDTGDRPAHAGEAR
jgi:hypothetical protein